MTHAEKKHRKELKRKATKLKMKKWNLSVNKFDIAEPGVWHPHPIQCTKKKSILYILRNVDKQNKQKTVDGYVK